MPSEVRHLVDRGQAYPLVRLSGVLDAETAVTVHGALLDVLAEQPEALIVDVTDLVPSSPRALDVLRDVRRETALWPAAHLALSVGDAAGAWQPAGWPIWPSSADAIAALGEPDPAERYSLPLEPQVGAARRSRELITEACARWARPALAGPACIVVTELVNNVVAHAHTSMVVLLAPHGDGMSVAVRDRSAVAPTFNGEPVPVTSYGGRGMLLVDSVAARWGHLALTDGKVVWALLTGEEPPEMIGGYPAESTGMPDPARG